MGQPTELLPPLPDLENASLSTLIATLDELDRGAGADLPSVSISVHRNCTVDGLLPFIRGAAYRLGHRAQVAQGDFDAHTTELLDLSRGPNVALAIVLVHSESLLVDDPASGIDLEATWQRLSAIIEAARGRNHPVALNSLWVPRRWTRFPTGGLERRKVEVLDQRLREACEGSSIRLIDLAGIVQELGEDSAYDARGWYRYRAPFTLACFRSIAREVSSILGDLLGRARKCIALDCDGTLWHGIVGEDGLAGIGLDRHQYPGNAYREFQRQLLRLKESGIMLALVSKNNVADVLEVLEKHPECLLSVDDLVGYRIDWNDKASNLEALARGLGIGLSSIVFIDDSEFECERVRRELPEVAVYRVPPEAHALPALLSRIPGLPTRPPTPEDRQRTRMYREEVARTASKRSFAGPEEFLASLEMKAEIGLLDATTVPRVAQLFSRTNQFMLTDHRASEAELAAGLHEGRQLCYWMRARDRYGDLGLVGAILLAIGPDALDLLAFAVSCRALGRSLEDLLFLTALGDAATRTGRHRLKARYARSPKNGQVADLLDRYGLTRTAEAGNVIRYEGPAPPPSVRPPSHVELAPAGGLETEDRDGR